MASPSTDHVSLSLLLPAIFYLLNSKYLLYFDFGHYTLYARFSIHSLN